MKKAKSQTSGGGEGTKKLKEGQKLLKTENTVKKPPKKPLQSKKKQIEIIKTKNKSVGTETMIFKKAETKKPEVANKIQTKTNKASLKAKPITALSPGSTKKRAGDERKNTLPLDQFVKKSQSSDKRKMIVEQVKSAKTSSSLHIMEENRLKRVKTQESIARSIPKRIKKRSRDKFDNIEALAKGLISMKEFKQLMEENDTLPINEPKTPTSFQSEEKIDAIKYAKDAINRYKAMLGDEQQLEFYTVEDRTYAREKLRDRILRQLFDECLDDVVRDINKHGSVIQKTAFQPYVDGMIDDIENACKGLDTFDEDIDRTILKNMDRILKKWKIPLSREAKKQLYKQSDGFTQKTKIGLKKHKTNKL